MRIHSSSSASHPISKELVLLKDMRLGALGTSPSHCIEAGAVSKECSTCNTAPRIERKCLINPLCDVVIVVDINEDVNMGVNVGVTVGVNGCRRRFEEKGGEGRLNDVNAEEKRKWGGIREVGGRERKADRRMGERMNRRNSSRIFVDYKATKTSTRSYLLVVTLHTMTTRK